MKQPTYTLAEVAAHIGAELRGEPNDEITGIAPIEEAMPGDITFINQAKYQHFLKHTKATAVIIAPAWAEQCSVPTLLTDNPYAGYAKAAQLFSQEPDYPAGIHASAIIGAGCQIDDSAHIGAKVVLEDNVRIGPNVVVCPGVIIGAGSEIGAGTHLWHNVTVCHGVKIGERTLIHAGAVIGCDGFGNAKEAGKWLKIPQIGGVIIGDDVEIGANTTIDRGSLGNTVIANGVRLDNQIQVGHNVRIGENTAIAACSGISGSVTIGKNCLISGMVGFTGHFEVADNVVITGMTVVSKPITKPGIYSSGTAIEPHDTWRKNAVRFRQLDNMYQRLVALEKQLATGDSDS
ncbi:MAG: UDP-3-O-(3-hydroxymyristoyl)glucosamine N-acyltransferase [Legionellales bacterium]|nr:UDP-3-O-(3-hydroxymyristoyl)glucosamine N-acyltransferase [Legionellales bacterium]